MFTLTIVFAIFAAVHVGVFYVASEVLQLTSYQFLIAIIGAAIISSVIAKLIVPDWKVYVEHVFNQEEKEDEAKSDAVGVIVVLIASAIIQNVLVARRYGVSRWAGIVAVNALVNAFF